MTGSGDQSLDAADSETHSTFSEHLEDDSELGRRVYSYGHSDISDLTLLVEKNEFKTHKMILAHASPVFKTMFYGEFEESTSKKVELKNVRSDDLNRCLEIFYGGHIEDEDFLLVPEKCLHSCEEHCQPATKCHTFDYSWCFGERDMKEWLTELWLSAERLFLFGDQYDCLERITDGVKKSLFKSPCHSDSCLACLSYLILSLEKNIDNFEDYGSRIFTRDAIHTLAAFLNDLDIAIGMKTFSSILLRLKAQ